MKTIRSYFVFGILLCLSFANSARADIEAQVSTFLQQQVERTDAPSLSVSVGQGGKVLLSVAAGFANKSDNDKADSNTQYRTGSVSKVIGTTAFMHLLEQKKVNLNDEVRHFLPYLPDHYNPIQIKHILTHTSGIRHYRFGEYGTNTHYSSLKDATKVFRDDDLLFAPGTRYQYSTYGINLLQGVIENVTEQPLAAYLETMLFNPVGMTNTELEVKGNESSQYAVGYRSFLSNMPVKDIDVSNKYIGGGMRTTPTDLVVMVQAINQGKVMSEKTKKLMLSIPFPTVAADRALGWRWMEHKGRKAFVHSGAINGFESFLAHFVKDDITIALMVNQDNYDYTGETLYKVLEIVRAGLDK